MFVLTISYAFPQWQPVLAMAFRNFFKLVSIKLFQISSTYSPMSLALLKRRCLGGTISKTSPTVRKIFIKEAALIPEIEEASTGDENRLLGVLV